jgi:glycosyltransferase involved in cell wall biosynthesis
MKIAVEARYLLAQEKSGVENYTYSLLAAMARQLGDDDLLLYLHRQPRLDEHEMLAPFLDSPHCHFHAVPPFKLWLKLWMPLAAKLHGADVGIYPGSILPWYNPFPSVMVVYDLCWSLYPECYPEREIHIFRDIYPRSLAAAKMVFAISEWTKSDIQRVYGTPAEKIRVIPCGVDPSYTPLPDAAERVRSSWNLEPGYILAVGTSHPRKDIPTLLEAYSFMKGDPPPLVLVGPPGGATDSLKARAEELGITARVRWLHYVPQKAMPALYSAAGVFAMPSLYEGFGMPVLEAMACGTPVVCANATVFPEVTAGAAILVEPRNAEAFSEAMTKVLAAKELAVQMRAKGLVRAKEYSWEMSARLALECIRDIRH